MPSSASAVELGQAPTLRLRRPLSRSLRGGHPWVYREALLPPPRLPAGRVVDLLDEGGQFIARGLYDPASPIAFRVYTLDPHEAVDGRLIRARLARALALRQQSFCRRRRADRCFSLVSWEGDLLPGLVIDCYGPVAVVVLDGGGESESAAAGQAPFWPSCPTSSRRCARSVSRWASAPSISASSDAAAAQEPCSGRASPPPRR